MHLLLNGKQDGSLQTVVLDRVHGAGQPGTVFISGTSVVDIFPLWLRVMALPQSAHRRNPLNR